MSISFERGFFRITKNNSEITKGLGLYSSLLGRQHWRDSREATWQVEKKSDNTLVLKGRWLFLPVTQTWTVRIVNHECIMWDVEMYIHADISMRYEDYKLMLSQEYKHWFSVDGAKGKLPKTYYSAWQTFWKKKSVQSVGFENVSPSLPTITMSNLSKMDNDNTYVMVQNSDSSFMGHVMGFTREKKVSKYLAGEKIQKSFKISVN